MKKIYVLLFALSISTFSFSQGVIQGFTIDPAAPTTTDVVKVYVDVMFTTMGCAVDNQNHSTAGSSTTGFAHHCLGMLTAICNTTDTFNLGMLPAGMHTFNMTLTSGIGGPPCTPGFIADDNGSITFTVTTATGISDYMGLNTITIYPNPLQTNATIVVDPKIKIKTAEFKIVDLMGRIVKTIGSIQTNEFTFDREQLSNGVYFYQLIQDETVISNGKLVIE
jgi:hypothetical protein